MRDPTPAHVVLSVAATLLTVTAPIPSAQELAPAGGEAEHAVTTARRVWRHLERSPLTLAAPELPPAALPGQPLRLQLHPTYSGQGWLTFALDSGPAGMTLDAETGVLEWTPPPAAAGTQASVGAGVTDGTYSASVAFTLAVARTAAIAAGLAGSTLTVTAAGPLRGMSLAFPPGAAPLPAQVALATVLGVSLPPLPAGARSVGEPFTATPVGTPQGEWITIALPASVVPAGAAPQDLGLYCWEGSDEDEGGGRWVLHWHDLDVLPSGTVTFKVGALGGLCAIGVAPPLPAEAMSPGVSLARVEAAPVPDCAARVLSNGHADLRRYVCTVAEGATQFRVDVAFSDFPSWGFVSRAPRNWAYWVASQLVDIVAWLPSGMPWPARVAVQVEDLGVAGVHGTSSLADHLGVLRIDAAPSSPKELGCALARTAFLWSAAHVEMPGEDNLALSGSRRVDWIVKGLARWFEDEVYDDVNSYRQDFRSFAEVPPVLGAGLAAYPNRSRPLTRPDRRALFWKMIDDACFPEFVPTLWLTANLAVDPTGAAAFERALSPPVSDCANLDAFPGQAGFDLASVLVAYSLFTEGANDVSKIEPGEPALEFEPPRVLVPSAEIAPGEYPDTARVFLRLPPASVVALTIAPVGQLPEGAGVVLTFTPGVDTIGVRARPLPLDGPGTATVLITDSEPRTYTYGSDGVAAGQFVAIVNPSLTDAAEVDVLAALTVPGAFQVTTTFKDPLNLVRSCVNWTATVAGKVSGPPELEVAARANALNPGQVILEVTGTAIVPPYHLTIEGTFDAYPDNASGSCTNSDGQSIRWAYTNKRIEHEDDEGEIVAGTEFGWELDGDSTAPLTLYRRVDAWWDLTVEILNPDGSVKSTLVRNDREPALLTVTVELNQP